ncbi:MAG: hypothetical protein Q7U97_10115, partial [Rhodocyclaceae bacterium]|nr:hypothetical protein [Rhodocyclaceae bacterium]
MSVRPPVLRRRLCTAVAMAFLSIAVAHAGDLALDIPAQDMGGAINLLARQANVQILFATNLVDGKRSP